MLGTASPKLLHQSPGKREAWTPVDFIGHQRTHLSLRLQVADEILVDRSPSICEDTEKERNGFSRESQVVMKPLARNIAHFKKCLMELLDESIPVCQLFPSSTPSHPTPPPRLHSHLKLPLPFPSQRDSQHHLHLGS